jgi:transposase-like protein
MTNRNIKSHLERVYDVEAWPELTSRATDATMEDARERRASGQRDGRSCQKSVYVAMGVHFEGEKEILGLWIPKNEVATFWASAPNEIRDRSAEDILIVRTDGIAGFRDAARAVFSERRIQKRAARMASNSAKFVSRKDLKAVRAGLKAIRRMDYTAGQHVPASADSDWISLPSLLNKDIYSSRPIPFSRSRDRKKNDNCFIERKNGAGTHRHIGYGRLEGDDLQSRLAAA